jgi:RNA polymerase-binding transcription factor DksA
MDSSGMASSHCDKELLSTFRFRNQKLADEISLAVQRIDDGEFGICCVCSKRMKRGLNRKVKRFLSIGVFLPFAE